MPAPAHTIHYTYEEYLRFEASSNVKHEYLGGQIYAMAGGTPRARGARRGGHRSAVPGSPAGAVPALRCRPPRPYAKRSLNVSCRDGHLRPLARDPEDRDAATNPTLIVEVLSRSTEEYDRGDRFEHYKSLPSLRQYVLVSHRERRVDVWTRGEGGDWTSVAAQDGETARLSSVGAGLSVDRLYEAAAPPG